MMRLRLFLGLIMTVVLLSIGLVSISGCFINATQGTPVTQSTSESPVAQPTSETLVVQPTPITNTGNATDKKELIAVIKENLLADIRSKAEQPYGGVYYVDAVTAKNLVDQTQAIFLDARYLVDYDVSHVSGAISLPVSSVWAGTIDPEKILPDKEAVYIAYCAPGCPAGLELAQELYIRGYNNVFVLSGGYLVWETAGYAMDKQKVKP